MRIRLGWLGWLVMVAVCIWLPWHALFEGSGPFVRQLSRSLAWKSIAECLLLLGTVYGSLRLRRGGIVLAVLCAEVYARRHGVDITVLLLAAYLAGLAGLGWCAAAVLRMPRVPRLDALLRNTLLGLVLWSAAIWIASLAGAGGLPALRMLAVFLLGGSVAIAFWRWRKHMPLPRPPAARADAFFVALVVTTVLMLAAKAAVAVDSDALWYGLNADRVLFGDGGLFHSQGLVAHVHYYPKLTEALQAPFLGLGSASLVTGLSLVCWVLLAITARRVLEELDVKGLSAWFGAFFACAVPAVAASAATPKGEILAAWLCILGLLAALRLRHGDAERHWLGIGLAAVLLAPLARLTVVPYAAALFLFIVAIALRRRTRPDWRIGLPVLFALAVAFLVCLRTFRQAGVALVSPDVLVNLQGLLGWHLHDDIGRYEPIFRTPFPDGLLDSLFGPAAYIHQALFWMGNGWLPLLVAAITLRGWRWMLKPALPFVLLLGLSMYVLLYAYRYGNDGADGNYFIVPIVLLHLAAWVGVFGTGEAERPSRAFVAGVAAMTAFCLFMVVTTANWFPGTGRLDARFDRTPFEELRTLAAARFRHSHMESLTGVLSQWPAGTRMLGDMPADDGGYFPVRYESLGTISWARPPLMVDEEAIVGLFRDHDIRLVALSHNPAAAVDEKVRPVLEDLVRRGRARKLNVAGGVADLWQLGPAPAAGEPGNMGGRPRR
ncbi:hypothetical protein [Luteibacter yeojuensis]|uniref:Glycosyltransferase RgtA/B/C/D-like domain-containing protein n=1 Tax=Luteibacter yeojuensis TaxID=345309 RepID=A0A7X5QUQ2_9GAMM|nr:hypothetical protein [Luteibacter yeojuensis]NID15757.1 hypothetical protein [Luteibacter yeojuensis]